MKIPPKSKIYEALSVIADKRIKMEQHTAKIKSSTKEKEYAVEWKDNQISSNDNASIWQKYPGYPILAVWMQKKILVFDQEIANYFKEINWHDLNKKNKRDYDKSVNDVLNKLVVKGIDTEYIEEQVDQIYDQICKLDFEIVRKIK